MDIFVLGAAWADFGAQQQGVNLSGGSLLKVCVIETVTFRILGYDVVNFVLYYAYEICLSTVRWLHCLFLYYWQVLRLARILRPLRLLKGFQSLRIMLEVINFFSVTVL